jgi:tetratricopeptide (TPR) repeat protein
MSFKDFERENLSEGTMTEVTKAVLVIACAGLILAGCGGEEAAVDLLPILPNHAQTVSFFGDTLFSSAAPSEAVLLNLVEAEVEYRGIPDDADALIWYGRRLAYAGQYREAINTYSEGIQKHPSDARIYRHRGHRYITLRMLDEAVEDFERAARLIEGTEDEIEPDGAPNAMNIPVSTLNTNIWYHLGLAYYLRDDMENALRAYEKCLRISPNDDMTVAATHWLYMILRRLGRDEDAAQVLEPITSDMELIENQAYHQLTLLYKGDLAEADLTGSEEPSTTPSNVGIAYGLGNWHFYNGNVAAAKEIFRQITESRGGWGGFGYIAAEADLSRME